MFIVTSVNIKVDKDTGAIKVVDGEFNTLSQTVGKTDKSVDDFGTKLSGMAKLAGGVYAIKEVFDKLIGTGFTYNAQLEDAKAGLVALSVAVQDKSIPVTQRYTLANEEAIKSLKELEKINAQTPHTLGQTNEIYKAMYIGMKKTGATTSDMVEITRSLSIASGAAGIEFNSLLAGVDGLASGTVEAGSDLGRFLSSLDLTNEKLKESKDVVTLLKNKLEDFKAADTMTVSVSNLTNAWGQLTGTMTADAFEVSKGAINRFSSGLTNLNKILKDYKQNIEAISDIKKFNDIEDITREIGDLEQKLIDLRETEKVSFLGGFGIKSWSNVRKKAHRDEIKDLNTLITLSKHHKIMLESDNKTVPNKTVPQIKKELESSLITSLSDWENYYKAIGDYKTAWLIEESKLSNKYVDLNKEQYESILGVAQTEYFDKINSKLPKLDFGIEIDIDTTQIDKALNLITSPIDKINTEFMSMHDAIDGLWDTDQMTKFYEVWQKSSEDALVNTKKSDKESSKSKELSTHDMIGSMMELASTAEGLYDEDSKKAKQVDDIKQVLRVADGVARIADLAMVVTSEGTKQSVYGTTALAAALATPFPASIPAYLTVSSMLASLGISVAGMSGGSSSESQVNEYEQNRLTIESEDGVVVNRLERQIDLLESIDRNGSSAMGNVANAVATFSLDTKLSIEDIIEDMGSAISVPRFDPMGMTDNSSYLAVLGAGLFDGLENHRVGSYDFNTDVLREDGNMLSLLTALQSFTVKGDLFLREEYVDMTATQKKFFGSVENYNNAVDAMQENIADYALSMVDTVNVMKDASLEFQDMYDSITGTTEYESIRLQNAYAKFDELRGKNSYSEYLSKQITAIQGVEDEFGTNIQDLLLSQDPTKMQEQKDAIDALSEATGVAFDGGVEDALNWIDSFGLVADSLANSNTNLKQYNDSYKTTQQIQEEVFGTFATNADELSAKVAQMSISVADGGDGFSDAELSYALANKDYLVSIEEITEAIVNYSEQIANTKDTLEKRYALLKATDEAEHLALTRKYEMNNLIDDSNKRLLESIYAEEDRQEALLNTKEVLIDSLNEESNALDDYMNDVTSNISILESSLGSLKGVIDKLKDSTQGSEYSLGRYNDSMSKTQALSLTNDYEAFQDSLAYTISASDALFNAENFDTLNDQKFAQAVAANQFEGMELTALKQIDYLELIEVNTREQISAILHLIEALGDKLDASLAIEELGLDSGAYERFISVHPAQVVSDALSQNTGQTDKTSGFTSVSDVFNNILGRDTVTQAGADMWQERADKVGYDVIASEISRSDEAIIKNVTPITNTSSVAYSNFTDAHSAQTVTAALSQNTGATTKTSGFSDISDVFTNVLGREPVTQAGADMWTAKAAEIGWDAVASLVSQSDEAKIKGVDSFANGGFTGQGIGEIDETGFKRAGIVHEEEWVAPKWMVDKRPDVFASLEKSRVSNSFATGGFTSPKILDLPVSNDLNVLENMLKEIKTLTKEVTSLKEENKNMQSKIVVNTQESRYA